MGDLSFARYFRLRPGRIECDAGGLRVGGVALLARDAKGSWSRRDEADLNSELSKLYGFPLDFSHRRKGLDAVAAALASRDLARALATREVRVQPEVVQTPVGEARGSVRTTRSPAPNSVSISWRMAGSSPDSSHSANSVPTCTPAAPTDRAWATCAAVE